MMKHDNYHNLKLLIELNLNYQKAASSLIENKLVI